MKEKTIPALQLAGTLLILGAMHIWAPVCTGLLDLTTGRQTHMKCWFSMQAATMVCIVDTGYRFPQKNAGGSSDCSSCDAFNIRKSNRNMHED